MLSFVSLACLSSILSCRNLPNWEMFDSSHCGTALLSVVSQVIAKLNCHLEILKKRVVICVLLATYFYHAAKIMSSNKNRWWSEKTKRRVFQWKSSNLLQNFRKQVDQDISGIHKNQLVGNHTFFTNCMTLPVWKCGRNGQWIHVAARKPQLPATCILQYQVNSQHP